MKKLLPFENYLLETDLSPDQVKSRIAEKSEAKNTVLSTSWQPSSKEYEGYIYQDTFIINRKIRYRNSFLPVINGQISRTAGKTQIRIKMQMETFVVAFMVIWLGGVGFGCVVIVLSVFANYQDNMENVMSPMLLIPFLMFLFGYLLVILSFKTESNSSRQFLMKLLEGKEIH